jgi:hypothetical protein
MSSVPYSLNVFLIISTFLNIFHIPGSLNVLLIISTYLNVFSVPDWLNVLRIISTYLNVFHVPDWLNVLRIILTYLNVFHVPDWLIYQNSNCFRVFLCMYILNANLFSQIFYFHRWLINYCIIKFHLLYIVCISLYVTVFKTYWSF